MEIRHLRAFIAVADAQSVRKAAGRLRVASSALSRTIRDLEHELGVALFTRNAHGARLTEAGIRFLEGARRTLVEAKGAIALARGGRASGDVLVLGVVQPEFRPAWINTALRRYREAMPDVSVQVVSVESVALAEAATRSTIDVGIGYALAPSHSTMVRPIMQDALAGVVVARAHTLARRRRVSIFDLQSYPFLWLDRARDPERFDLVFNAFRHAGFVPQFVSACGPDSNVELGLALVSSGLGWALYPSAARPGLPPTLRYLPLTDLSIPLSIDLIIRADDRSLRTRAFRQVLEQLAADASEKRVRVPASPVS